MSPRTQSAAATDSYKRGYAKGYASGSRREWPEHKPPLPPHKLIRALFVAANELIDAADGICAVLDEDDVFVATLGPKIDSMDKVMEKVTAWLLDKPDETDEECDAN